METRPSSAQSGYSLGGSSDRKQSKLLDSGRKGLMEQDSCEIQVTDPDNNDSDSEFIEGDDKEPSLLINSNDADENA
jgi:hypothetical protein